MTFILNLPKNEYELVPEGVLSMRIVSMDLKPAFRPEVIEAVYEDSRGRKIKSTYTIANDKSLFVFSLVARAILGDVTQLSLDMINSLINQFVQVEVKHTTKESTKEDGKMNTFANISKIIGKGTPFGYHTIDVDALTGELVEAEESSDLMDYDDL